MVVLVSDVFQSFETELPLALKDPPGLSQIEAHLHLAQLHTDMFMWDTGLEYANQACVLARRAGERVHLADAYVSLAYTTLMKTLANKVPSVFSALELQRQATTGALTLAAPLGSRKDALAKIERLLYVAQLRMRASALRLTQRALQAPSKINFQQRLELVEGGCCARS